MRYPKKREMLAYYILATNGRRLEYGEAIKLLGETLCLTPRVARSVIKRLRNMNYIKLVRTGTGIIVEPKEIASIFKEMIEKYSSERCRRLGSHRKQ